LTPASIDPPRPLPCTPAHLAIAAPVIRNIDVVVLSIGDQNRDFGRAATRPDHPFPLPANTAGDCRPVGPAPPAIKGDAGVN